MNKYPDLTYKMIGHSVVESFDYNECVDWAIQMLQAGHETRSVIQLAGTATPTDYFETENRLNAALDELQIGTATEENAIVAYATYHVLQLKARKDMLLNLSRLSELAFLQEESYHRMSDFSLLHDAWTHIDDLFYAQLYWPNVNENNIEDITVETADAWLKEHEEIISSLF